MQPPSETRMNVTWTSPVSGFIGNDCGQNKGTCRQNSSYTLHVPEGKVMMISFPFFELGNDGDYIMLRTLGTGEMSTFMWKRNAQAWIPAQVYNSSLEISFVTEATAYSANPAHLVFSFHQQSDAPIVLGSGLYDCSGPNFLTFRHHVDCNFILECEGLEDIESCPECDIHSKKCYKVFKGSGRKTWYGAQKSCQRDGGDLAMMKTLGEWDTLSQVAGNMTGYNAFMWIGMHSLDSTMPDYYKHVYFWADNLASYSANTTDILFQVAVGKMCFFVTQKSTESRHVAPASCSLRSHYSYICQRELVNTSSLEAAVDLPSLIIPSDFNRPSNLSLITCEEDHYTHNFLSCDPESHCGEARFRSHCHVIVSNVSVTSGLEKDAISFAMFACDDETGGRTLPYTLVCDFRPDCDHSSDETFCMHRLQCDGYRCSSGQCAARSSHCDITRDCWDGSDEKCNQVHLLDGTTTRLSVPSVITYDGRSLNFAA